jgi:hypothetical protein
MSTCDHPCEEYLDFGSCPCTRVWAGRAFRRVRLARHTELLRILRLTRGARKKNRSRRGSNASGP